VATNFPGSQDSLTNPTSSDTLDSPDHAGQHTDANDAIEAIQGALLDGAPLHIDDTNERVGVGTSSPEDVLHVVGDVTIEFNDDGSLAQPEVTLHRESASPADGDYLGQVKFSGKNDAGQTVNYAKITGKISDASDTSEDGLIEIANISGGSQSIGYRFTSTDLKLLNGRGLEVDGDVTVDTDTLHVDATNNRVGIGTDSPQRLMDIRGASNPEIRFQSTDSSDPFIYFGDQVDAVRGGIGYDTSANALQLRGYNNSTRVAIDSSGNVGINDTTPSYKLDVNGDINATGALRIGGSAIGDVQTWTPSFNFMTQGNGTYTAEYVEVNDLIFFHFLFTLGSTSSVSSGMRIGLPKTATYPYVYANSFVHAYDTSAATRTLGHWYFQESGATARPAALGTSTFRVTGASSFSNTYPFTWGSGDQLFMSGVYLAA